MGAARKPRRPIRNRRARLVVAGLVVLGLFCLVMAWQHYGLQGAYFDADPTAPATAGTRSGGGLSRDGVLWLIAGIVLLAGAVVTALSRPKR
jgi:hypothetical protein